MAPSTQDRMDTQQNTDTDIDSLMHEHRTLDAQVSELANKSHLTPEEDLELHRLKKEKLRLKDKIEAVLHSRKSA